jgi:hypothetical protein
MKSSMADEISLPTQLDLFVHGGGTLLANGVIEALERRDALCAADRLRQLGAAEPGYRGLAELGLLCRTLGDWPPPLAHAAQIAAEVARLQHEVEPAARAVIPMRAAGFLRTFWRDLAEAADGQAYDARWPQAFAADLYLRCGDNAAAAERAAAIPDRDDNPDALHWLAVAHCRGGKTDPGRRSLMRLALLAPQRLPATLAETGDVLVQREWRAFQDACFWAEAGEDGAWFAAWYVLGHPDTAKDVDRLPLPDAVPAQALALLGRLLELEKHGYSPALAAGRSRLRDLHAEFFALYMAQRETGRRGS